MTHQLRLDLVSAFASFAPVEGVGHVYDIERPTKSWVPPHVDLSRIKRCEIANRLVFVVHVRSQKPVAHLLKVFGDVQGLNSSRTAFKVTFEKQPPACLAKGFFMIEHAFAEIRPFLPEDEWAKTPHVTALLLRGPNSESEILEWWPALQEKQANIFRRGKTWIIKSGFHKRSAPERSGKRASWKLIAAGHCFSCGHAGHTEANCPCHRSKCRRCGSPAHTAEVCPVSSKKLSLSAAARKLGVIRRAIKFVKSHNGDLPPAMCRLLEEAEAAASDVLNNPPGSGPRRRLRISRPGEQHPANPVHAPQADGLAGAAAAASAAAPSEAPAAPSPAPLTPLSSGSKALPVSARPPPAADEGPALGPSIDSSSPPEAAAAAASAASGDDEPAKSSAPGTPDVPIGGKRQRSEGKDKASATTKVQTTLNQHGFDWIVSTPLTKASRQQGSPKRKRMRSGKPPTPKRGSSRKGASGASKSKKSKKNKHK